MSDTNTKIDDVKPVSGKGDETPNTDVDLSDVSELANELLDEIDKSDAKKIKDNAELTDGIPDEEYANRNKYYTLLLGEYVDSYKKRNILKAKWKEKSIIWILILLSVLIVSICSFIIIIAINDNFDVESVIAIVTSLAALVSTMIAIPKIIFEYLFPTSEDDDMTKMIEVLQKNDDEIRKKKY